MLCAEAFGEYHKQNPPNNKFLSLAKKSVTSFKDRFMSILKKKTSLYFEHEIKIHSLMDSIILNKLFSFFISLPKRRTDTLLYRYI